MKKKYIVLIVILILIIVIAGMIELDEYRLKPHDVSKIIKDFLSK